MRTELMSRVLLALGQAKRSGVHNICFYDQELHRREQLQNYIESHMKQALHDHEFQMYLQPKINLKTGQLGGAEALVRWVTGDGKMIFPDQFIPLFEENGFCVQLDLYMVEQACGQLRRWMDQGRQRLIMQQIILLAQKMDMSTVAEGVETAKDEAMIRELGCDFGQGYYYSRPIRVEEFGERYMKQLTAQ